MSLLWGMGGEFVFGKEDKWCRIEPLCKTFPTLYTVVAETWDQSGKVWAVGDWGWESPIFEVLQLLRTGSSVQPHHSITRQEGMSRVKR